MPIDIGDLLEGLNSDDLDDFELDGDALDEEDSAAPTLRSASDAFAWDEEEEESHGGPLSLFGVGQAPAVGFVTAKGRALPPPSLSALEKAIRLLGEEEDAVDVGPSPKRRRLENDPPAFTTGMMRPITPPSAESRRKAMAILGEVFDTSGAVRNDLPSIDFDEELAPHPLPRDGLQPGQEALVGSTSASITRHPVPSRTALQRGAHIFDDDPSMSTPPRPSMSAFTTGSGAQVAPPSAASQAAAAALFGDTTTPKVVAGSQMASGSPALLASTSRNQALNMFADTPSRPTGPSSRDVALSILNDADSRLTPRHGRLPPPGNPQFRSPLPSGFRTPLRATTNTSASPSSRLSSSQGGTQKGRPIEIKTPSTMKHLGTGRTPQSRGTSGMKAFKTPFKTPSSLSKPKVGTKTAPTPVRAPVPRQDEPVFDLTSEWYQTWKIP
jgi:hypothetical protein